LRFQAVAPLPFEDLGQLLAVVIAAISSYFGIRRVLKIEPFDIFRG
jgi:putative ABC transport system permease protein